MPEFACGSQPFPFDEVSVPIEWRLPDDDSAAAKARFWVGEALELLGLPADLIGDARLAISELAGNAVRHACPPYALRIYPGKLVIVCEITDQSRGMPSFPAPQAAVDTEAEAAALSECGRGLAIVAGLTGGYCGARERVASTSPYREAKAVWFALRTPPPALRPGHDTTCSSR